MGALSTQMATSDEPPALESLSKKMVAQGQQCGSSAPIRRRRSLPDAGDGGGASQRTALTAIKEAMIAEQEATIAQKDTEMVKLRAEKEELVAKLREKDNGMVKLRAEKHTEIKQIKEHFTDQLREARQQSRANVSKLRRDWEEMTQVLIVKAISAKDAEIAKCADIAGLMEGERRQERLRLDVKLDALLEKMDAITPNVDAPVPRAKEDEQGTRRARLGAVSPKRVLLNPPLPQRSPTKRRRGSPVVKSKTPTKGGNAVQVPCPQCVVGSGKILGHLGRHRLKVSTPKSRVVSVGQRPCLQCAEGSGKMLGHRGRHKMVCS